MIRDLVAKDPLLQAATDVRLEIEQSKSNYVLKIGHHRNGKGTTYGMPFSRSHIPQLIKRWGHVIDFEPMRLALEASGEEWSIRSGYFHSDAQPIDDIELDQTD